MPDTTEFSLDFEEVVNVGGGTSDFNELSNRPKYNGQQMTGDTNIPEVPTATSDLDNDSNYQTAAQVQTTVSSAVGSEAETRQTADNNLQSQIDAISASSDVKDIVGTYAELQSYDTSTLNNNDIIKVLQDESHSDETTYYRWSTQTQSFTLIGEEGPYYTKSQTDTLLNGKQDTLTAGTNVTIENNTISSTDTTYSDFEGTDGQDDGEAGLVPAPEATDADKFLKSDGTWANAGGGGVTELTSADYNWPENNPDGVALWKLKKGLYYQATGTKLYVTTSVATPMNGMYLYVATDDTYANIFYGNINSGWLKASYTISSGNRLSNTTFLNTTDHLVQTTGTSTSSVMSQDATSSMVYADPANKTKVQIGNTSATGNTSVALGRNAQASGSASVALGSYSTATSQGELSVGGNLLSGSGYNNTSYRLITNVHDPVNAQDAATKAYVDANAGGVTPVQTTGTSTTDVMSQDATSKMIYVDPTSATSGIAIGKESPQAASSRAIAIGNDSRANFGNSVALGYYARPTHSNSVALGAGAVTTATSQVSIQKVSSGYGYNNTVYTLLSGLYDPQNDHDAANKQYVDSQIAALEARIAALEGN